MTRETDAILARCCAVLSRERLSSEGRAVVVILRGLRAARRPRRPDVLEGQRALALVGDLRVEGCPLGTDISWSGCVGRQLASEREIGTAPAEHRSSRQKRGRVASFASCVTARCAVGREIRQRLGDTPRALAMAAAAPRAQHPASN